MIILISPAKTLDLSRCNHTKFEATQPLFKMEIVELVSILKKKNAKDLMSFMKISEKIAKLNFDRYQKFDTEFTYKNSKPAIIAFKGDVYQGIDIESYKKDDFEFAQKHLRILSGLYGIIRPLDLIQPYRLEMGVKAINLYKFWKYILTSHVKIVLEKEKVLINLASKEYFSAIDLSALNSNKIINVVFKYYNKGKYKILGILAKRARGKMVNFIIKNKIQNYKDLREFDVDGYIFNGVDSDENNFVFLRR